MAHEIDTTTGKAAMAFVGQLPWHGLGKELTEDAPIEVWRKEAGMDWEIKTSPVLYKADGSEDTLEMPDRRLFYRSDTNAALSVVSGKFKIVQPGATLEFYRSLVETTGFKLETAGCLFGGRKFWALARCGESIKLLKEDEVKPYLLIASACDGSMSTVAHFTSVRVVCNNTLRMAVGNNGQRASVRVPHNTDFDPEAVKEQLGIAGEVWNNFSVGATSLAKMKIGRDEAIDFVAQQLKDERFEGMNREEMLEGSVALRNIIRLFEGDGKGSSMKSAKGTGWGLVNAVTEHFDHWSGAKNGDKSRAFERAHITDKAAFKVTFANELLKMAA